MKKKFIFYGLNKAYINFHKLLITMKITAFLLFCGMLNAIASPTYSQLTKISLDLKNSTIEQVLDNIEQRSEFYFLYNQKLIDVTRKVDITAENKSIRDILDDIFKSDAVKCVVYDRQIILTSNEDAYRITEQQQKVVTGKITDQDGAPLPGVSVVITGTSTGTISNAQGQYTIENFKPENELSFSFIGYISQKFIIGNQRVINIVMVQELTSLDEVVVVGYGTQKKVNLTGSVSAVSTKELAGKVATSSLSTLQGTLPGVFITEGTGLPGKTNLSIMIRGRGTMNNSDPMVIVDGLESTLNDVNPNDIESISVLKDAAAAAIYGTRASNGVILVTTKRGRKEPLNVTYNVYVGKQKPTRLMEVLNSYDLATLFNESLVNDGKAPTWNAQDMELFKSGTDPVNHPSVNYLDLALEGGSGMAQDHDLSISGGTEFARYRVSLGYFDQDGLTANTSYDRYNGRFNLDSKINNWLSVGLNSSFSNGNTLEPCYTTSQVIGQVFRNLMARPAWIPVKNEAGEWVPWVGGNPIAALEEGGILKISNNRFSGSIFSEITILKGLTLFSQAGVGYSVSDSKTHIRTIALAGMGTPGKTSVTDVLGQSSSITLQSYLNYSKNFGKHETKTMIGASREESFTKSNSGFRESLPGNDLEVLNAGTTTGMTNAGTASDSKLGSYFGRINYIYDSKYLFEANLRIDGSCKFARDYRWGYFPSFSAGWILSKERFMQNLSSLINNLKFRASWGQLGNHSISNYLYIDLISLGQDYALNNSMISGAATTAASVGDISWEKTTITNFGLDLDLIVGGNIFSATVDYYDRYTDDILTTVPVSSIFGLTSPTINYGAMRNKGMEFTFGYNRITGHFRYDLSTNFSYNTNRVERFPAPAIVRTDPKQVIRTVREPWEAFYGYKVAGIAMTDAEALAKPHVLNAAVKAGDLYYVDQNDDKVIDAKDRVVLGDPIPKYNYGFNLNFSYKNFDVRSFFQGVLGATVFIGNQIQYPWSDGEGHLALKFHMDRTQVEGDHVVKLGRWPRLSFLSVNSLNREYSDFWLYNGNYLRLKNLQFGYTLPSGLTEKIKIRKARVYYSGSNLITVDSKEFPDSFDPEVQGYSGRAQGVYPQVKFHMFGIEISL